jgi:hypothetical protein
MCVPDANGEDSLPTSTLNGDARPYESATTKQRESRIDLTPITLVMTPTGTQPTTTTKSNRRNNNNKRSSKDATSTIYSHSNIQGGKDPLKLQYITNQMKERGIDMYLLQETWKCGTYTDDIING